MQDYRLYYNARTLELEAWPAHPGLTGARVYVVSLRDGGVLGVDMPEADGNRQQALGEAMVGAARLAFALVDVVVEALHVGAAGEQVGPLDPGPIDAFGVVTSGLIYGHAFKPVLVKS